MKKLTLLLLLALVSSSTADLLVNPGFENSGSTNTTAMNWEDGSPDAHGKWWGSFFRTDWRAHGGSWEGAIRGTWAGEGTNGGVWQERICNPGAEYELSVWFWADLTWTSTVQGLSIDFYDEGVSNRISGVTNLFDGVGTNWVAKSVSAEAPTNAVWARASIWADDVGAAGGLQFDDVVMRPIAGNHLQNPGFENAGLGPTNALHWNWGDPDVHGGWWGSTVRTNWRAHAGSWEAGIRGTWAGLGDSGGIWQERTGVPGRQYTASGWFWADSAWTSVIQGLKLEFYTTGYGDPLLVVTNAFDDVEENWVRKKVQAIAPPNAAWARTVIWADGAGTDGALQFDDMDMISSPGGTCFVVR